MYPFPQHFIVRPGPTGRGETIVPLIAVDQLPDWIQLAGVPRHLNAEQVVGMVNLGLFAGDGLIPYEVRLRLDRVRAIVTGKAQEDDEKPLAPSDSINKKEKEVEEQKVLAKPTFASLKQSSEIEAEGRRDKALKDIQKVTVLPKEIAAKVTNTETSPLVREDRTWDSESDVTSPDKVSEGRKKQNKSMRQQCDCDIDDEAEEHPTELTLSASRHNATTKAAGDKLTQKDRPIRAHLIEEMKDKQARRVVVPRSKGNSLGTTPVTNYCRHWCHHGTCKWGWECRYQHRMPTNQEGLREVGLKDFPMWYLLMVSGSGFPGMEVDSTFGRHGGMNMSSNPVGSPDHPLARNNTTGRHPDRGSYPASTLLPTSTRRQTNPLPLHASPTDLRLMQGRMAALLAGSTAMSNRQKLREIKEMRDLFLRTTLLEQNHPANLLGMGNTPPHHRGRANLHTNASVAANAAGLSAASRRQELHEAERGAAAPVGSPSRVCNGELEASRSYDELEGRLSPVGSDGDGEGGGRNNTEVREGRLVDVE